jgi:hypothetical protein
VVLSGIGHDGHIQYDKYDFDAEDENNEGVAEGLGNMEIGQQMANDGITYSPEKEKEIIGLMAQYMKKAGMSPKQIRYLLNYNEDYISDQLSFLPRQGEADTMESMLKLAGLKK